MNNPDQIPIETMHRSLGATQGLSGRIQFCVWAPEHDRVTLHLLDPDREIAMRRHGAYYVAQPDDVRPGDRYFLRFGEGPDRPDPTSRFQPCGVHGPSEVVSSQFDWTDTQWPGVATEQLVIYELHVGTFTPDGTYRSAIERLDELVDLGITAIELMPLSEAAGRWNWGYDGVCLFAPNHNYGSPDDLRCLVDAAHRKGLAVILDVVYNHFGPEGNYLGDAGPYLSPVHTTAWGAAPNVDDPKHGDAVRRWLIANAVYWLDEFHFDGLRLDAIHCMKDRRDPHIVRHIRDAVRSWSSHAQRPALLIAESNVYDPEMTLSVDKDGIGFDAQWCDDFLHSVFAILRPGEQLCHRTYQSPDDLDQTMRNGFVYEGTLRQSRGRRIPEQRVDTSSLIYSIQNHDFIGNHPLGQRLHQLSSDRAQRAAAALLILSPAIPMLFMGEEFACDHPFQFFVDFSDDHLRQAVVEGRRREYPQHDWSSGNVPTDPTAFLSSKIGSKSDGDEGMWDWYRSLIRLRKQWRDEGLLGDTTLTVASHPADGVFQWQYRAGQRTATVAVRLSSTLPATERGAFSRANTDALGTDEFVPTPLPCPGACLLDSDRFPQRSTDGERPSPHASDSTEAGVTSLARNQAKVFCTA